MNKNIEQLKEVSKRERTIVLALFILALISVISYIFLIHGTIYNIVGEKRVSGDAGNLEAKLIELEKEYFAKAWANMCEPSENITHKVVSK